MSDVGIVDSIDEMRVEIVEHGPAIETMHPWEFWQTTIFGKPRLPIGLFKSGCLQKS